MLKLSNPYGLARRKIKDRNKSTLKNIFSINIFVASLCLPDDNSSFLFFAPHASETFDIGKIYFDKTFYLDNQFEKLSHWKFGLAYFTNSKLVFYI